MIAVLCYLFYNYSNHPSIAVSHLKKSRFSSCRFKIPSSAILLLFIPFPDSKTLPLFYFIWFGSHECIQHQ